MKEFKGTKGPWIAKYILGYPRSSDSPYVQIGNNPLRFDFGGDVEVIEADLKLIATAPELLEALQDLMRCIKDNQDYDRDYIRGEFKQAEQAIKKAI